jgi:hypothetical protein
MARQSLREVSQFVDEGLTMYLSKLMTFPTPHSGLSRHDLFFTRLDCQSNVKPSEKDHDLPGIRTRDPWSSSQHTQPLHHLGRLQRKLQLNIDQWTFVCKKIFPSLQFNILVR